MPLPALTPLPTLQGSSYTDSQHRNNLEEEGTPPSVFHVESNSCDATNTFNNRSVKQASNFDLAPLELPPLELPVFDAPMSVNRSERKYGIALGDDVSKKMPFEALLNPMRSTRKPLSHVKPETRSLWEELDHIRNARPTEVLPHKPSRDRWETIPTAAATNLSRPGHYELNANEIRIHRQPVAIASQYPDSAQVEQYLDCMLDKKTPVLVVLASQAEVDFPDYDMPDYFARSQQYKHLSTLVLPHTRNGNIALDDKIQAQRYRMIIKRPEGNTLNAHEVEVIHVKNWKDRTALSAKGTEQLSKLISAIADKKASHSPPWIHCRAGVGRTGQVIGSMAIRDHAQLQRSVLEIVRAMRQSRNTELVQTPEQLDTLVTLAKQHKVPLKPAAMDQRV